MPLSVITISIYSILKREDNWEKAAQYVSPYTQSLHEWTENAPKLTDQFTDPVPGGLLQAYTQWHTHRTTSVLLQAYTQWHTHRTTSVLLQALPNDTHTERLQSCYWHCLMTHTPNDFSPVKALPNDTHTERLQSCYWHIPDDTHTERLQSCYWHCLMTHTPNDFSPVTGIA